MRRKSINEGAGIVIQKDIEAWDPDFTKVTPEEAAEIETAEASGFVNAEDIDWDHLEKYTG